MSKYSDKVYRWVLPYTGASFAYVFPTNVDESVQTILGQRPVNTINVIGAITPNRPRPARYGRPRRTIAESAGRGSSFIDPFNFATAAANGFKKIEGALLGPAPRNSSLSVRVYAEVLPGINYSWDMTREQYNKIGADRSGVLGVQDLQANTDNVVVAPKGFVSPQFATQNVYGAKQFIENGVDGEDTVTVGFIDYLSTDTAEASDWQVFANKEVSVKDPAEFSA